MYSVMDVGGVFKIGGFTLGEPVLLLWDFGEKGIGG
jgi:hypothetical protein